MMLFEVSNGSETETIAAATMLDTCNRLGANGALALTITKIEGDKRTPIVVNGKPAGSAPAPIVRVEPVHAPIVPQAVAILDAEIVADTALMALPPVNVDLAPQGWTSIEGDATAPAKPVSASWTSTVSDDTAKARIDAQQAALRAGGLTGIGHKATGGDGEQFYANGTRMMDVGYATQAGRKAEHDKSMLLADAAHALSSMVRAEGRSDRECSARDFGQAIEVNGKITAFGYSLTERAIRGLFARLEQGKGSVGAMGYVLGLRERIAGAHLTMPEGAERSRIIAASKCEIADVLRKECLHAGDVAFKVRTRNAPHDIFALVSPSYANADAPESMGELVTRLPASARGAFTYDATSTSWELRASVWTPTPVEEQAVGEAFEGYASFRGRDNGTGRWEGGGGVTFIRCLNASTYTADSAKVSRVHRGAVLSDVKAVVDGASAACSILCKAWGVNRERVLALPSGVPIEVAIPGFYRALLTDRRELLPVLRGRTEANVEGLTRAYWSELRGERSIVHRSDLAQGWTKYAQSQGVEARSEAEAAIGSWLARAIGNADAGCSYVEARA
jgi:hypothetical protein